MKKQYEHKFLYFLLVYIFKLTYNEECIFLYLNVELIKNYIFNTTFLIHQFKFLTNVPKTNPKK